MTYDDARRLALDALAQRGAEGGRELVLQDQYTLETAQAWVFAYQSAEFVRTGRREFRLLGNGPLYVNRDTGAVAFLGAWSSRDQVITQHLRHSLGLDDKDVPPSVRKLIPFAVRWGVGDDIYRENMVHRAGDKELDELVHSIDGVADDDLYGWLAGPESHSTLPSAAYLAFTSYTMAIDSARVALQRRRNS